jgi:hypothetical protein
MELYFILTSIAVFAVFFCTAAKSTGEKLSGTGGQNKDVAKWYQDIDWQARMSNHKRLQAIKNR